MKIGLITSIFEGMGLKEVVDLQRKVDWNVWKWHAGRLQEGKKGAMQESAT